jgi:lysophospholipase L1-like esterase
LAGAAAILSGALVLGGLELVLRATKPARPENDFVTVTWGHPVSRNALGYREREVALPKPAGVFRVMVLGDSLTWGAGLAEQERYTNVLQERLGNNADTRRVEVLNFALSGLPTTAERDALEKLAPIVAPDLVVVGFCVNDPQPGEENYAVELDRYQWLFRTIKQLHRRHFRESVQFLSGRLDLLLRNLGLVPQWQEALARTYEPDSPEWQAFTGALRDIHALATAGGKAPPIFIPLLQGDGDYNAPSEHLRSIMGWSRQAADAARDAGFVVVEVEATFKKEGNRQRRVLAWDGHPDPQSNRVYAGALEPAVRAAAPASNGE